MPTAEAVVGTSRARTHPRCPSVVQNSEGVRLTPCASAAGACGAAARPGQNLPARLRRANAPVSSKRGLGNAGWGVVLDSSLFLRDADLLRRQLREYGEARVR